MLPPPIVGSTAAIRYLFGTTVPENWIPFLPVHEPGSVQDIRFQRAAMPKLGVPPREVIKAKGVFLTEVQPLYYINEAEIPYAGTMVRRCVPDGPVGMAARRSCGSAAIARMAAGRAAATCDSIRSSP